ncbi:MTH1187 family thiamine-binding protein [Candidatus Calescamantes bacterium]|nr:MTH1187 family thiamine-binding protein [Candidatus Calescamantes bacterium]
MAIAEISIIPIGTSTPSVSKYVAKAVEVLKRKGVKFEITSMGTIVEGEISELLKLVEEMHRAVLESDVVRVVTTVKIDERKDKPLTIEGKVSSLKEKLVEKI